MITTVTRIWPINAQSGQSTNLLNPSDLGEPIEVQKRFVTNPKTDEKFLFETTFCLAKTNDLSNLNIPGLTPLTSLDCAVKNVERSPDREFALSIPRRLPLPKLPQFGCLPEIDKLDSTTSESHIKHHLNLKKKREEAKAKHLIRKKEKLARVLFKYLIDNECLICGVILKQSSKNEVMSHMLSHVDVKSGGYVCEVEVCGEKFSSAEVFYAHSIFHKLPEETKYICKICNYKFSRRFILSLHCDKKHFYAYDKSTSQLVTNFVCTVCRIQLSSWKSLVLHKNYHFGKENYKCLICYKVFVSSSRFLRYHAHLTPKLIHKCKYCKKIFMSRCRLREHETNHLKVVKHVCDLCGRKFNFISSFRKHMQLHSQN